MKKPTYQTPKVVDLSPKNESQFEPKIKSISLVENGDPSACMMGGLVGGASCMMGGFFGAPIPKYEFTGTAVFPVESDVRDGVEYDNAENETISSMPILKTTVYPYNYTVFIDNDTGIEYYWPTEIYSITGYTQGIDYVLLDEWCIRWLGPNRPTHGDIIYISFYDSDTEQIITDMPALYDSTFDPYEEDPKDKDSFLNNDTGVLYTDVIEITEIPGYVQDVDYELFMDDTLEYNVIRWIGENKPEAGSIFTVTFVRNTLIYAKTGTLDLPIENNVRNNIKFDGETKQGNIILPTEAEVQKNVGFGSEGTEFTGTMLGDLPEEVDVRDGVSFGMGEKEGTLDLPAVADVKEGVSFDNETKVGILETPTVPLENDVRNGVEFGENDSLEGNLELPIEEKVEKGIQYGANGTEFTGELISSYYYGEKIDADIQGLDFEVQVEIKKRIT